MLLLSDGCYGPETLFGDLSRRCWVVLQHREVYKGLTFPFLMIRRLGCLNAILLGGVAFGVVHLWLSWACCHRCKSQSPGAQCCCPVIRLRFVCALVRLTDSIAPDHYTGRCCWAQGSLREHQCPLASRHPRLHALAHRLCLHTPVSYSTPINKHRDTFRR